MGKWLVLFAGRSTSAQWIVWSGPHKTEAGARGNAAQGREHKMGGRWLVCQITWEWPEHEHENAHVVDEGAEGG